MTAPSIEDRIAITDLTVAYCWAIDGRRWDVLDDIFTADAYAELGEVASGREAIKVRIASALGPLDDSQHMVTNHDIDIDVDGDRATCRCYFQAQHVRKAAVGGANFIIAGRYEDSLVRIAAGWRIDRRILTIMWREGNVAVVRPDLEPTIAGDGE
jgi:hypothetical protein